MRLYILFFLCAIGLLCFEPFLAMSQLPADTIVSEISTKSTKRQKNDSLTFVQRLHGRMDKHRFTRLFSDAIFEDLETDVSKDVTEHHNEIFNGKIIASIKTLALDPFGTKITDTLYFNDKWLNRFGNTLHSKTKDKRLRNNLLFKEGDVFDNLIISDSERLLRNLEFIEDALIHVEQDPNYENQVNVVVVVRDLFDIEPTITFKGIDQGSIGLGAVNILGYGLNTRHKLLWDNDEDPILGYRGEMGYNNIAGSFIDVKAHYQNQYMGESVGIDANRGFYAPSIRHAGGVGVSHNTDKKQYLIYDATRFSSRYVQSYLWYGYSIPLTTKSTFRNNLTFSGLMYNKNLIKKDRSVENVFYTMQSKLRLFGKVTYSHQDFVKTNNVYNFGRTEDIPIGVKLDFTTGWELREEKDRLYTSIGMGVGTISNKGYYFAVHSEFGGFLTDVEKQQSTYNIRWNMFSPLFRLGAKGYSLRTFVNASYVGGHKMYDDEYVSLHSDKLSVSNYKTDSIYGKQKMIIDIETDLFTPWRILGFNTVFFAFGNASWIDASNHSLMDSDFYASMGFGLRMRNEMFVFDTIQLKFSYFPIIPEGMSPKYIKVSGEPYYRVKDFAPTAPSLVEYR